MPASSSQSYLDLVPDTATPVDEPLVIEDPDAFGWDDACDMLVVGWGLAGASAALKGAEIGGMDIILADRFGGGGTSAISGGVVYAGGGTRVQKSLGIEDSPEGLAEYLMKEVGEIRSHDTVRRFASSSPGMIDWLEARGVKFDGPLDPRKTSYPSYDTFLYHSGNEKAPAYRGEHPPAPRGHRARSDDPAKAKEFSGAILMEGLRRYIETSTTIRPYRQSAARRLITDRNGRVVGVEFWRLDPGSEAARKHQSFYDRSKVVMYSVLGLSGHFWKQIGKIERAHAKPVRVRASRGVILSTGGYIHNHPMVEKTAPVYAAAGKMGTLGCDGSAVRMGQSVGARLGQMHLLSPWRFVSPPMAWIKGVMVGLDGQRLVNEELYGARLGEALFEKSGGKGWLIVDEKVQEEERSLLKTDNLWPYQKLPTMFANMIAKRGRTIDDLERKMKLPKGVLVETIERYNDDIQAGRADAFQKSDGFRQPLVNSPFYAIYLGHDAALNPIGAITLGGLDVDEYTNAVRSEGGDTIPGLFAAGRSAVGVCSENYVSGLSLADCIWSGWQAASGVAGNNPPAA